jgi:hypothetical protein
MVGLYAWGRGVRTGTHPMRMRTGCPAREPQDQCAKSAHAAPVKRNPRATSLKAGHYMGAEGLVKWGIC